jgi:hypothetical protein
MHDKSNALPTCQRLMITSIDACKPVLVGQINGRVCVALCNNCCCRDEKMTCLMSQDDNYDLSHMSAEMLSLGIAGGPRLFNLYLIRAFY